MSCAQRGAMADRGGTVRIKGEAPMPSSQLHNWGIRPVPRATAVPEIEERLGPSHTDGERPPILLIFGPRGIGKTTLLRELDEDFAQRTPRALVECSSREAGDIRQLLIQIKFELGRHCPGIGRLRFRRLEIGLAATRERIAFDGNPRHAVRRLLDLILEEISTHPDDVGVAVGNWVDRGTLSMVPVRLRRLATAFLATVSRLLSRRLLLRLLRRYLNWYGHRDQQHKDDPIDVLASLNRSASSQAIAAQRDERLIEAFLADVRDLFGRGRLARSTWFNCVLLVDDIDTDLGQRLLRYLQQLRLDLRIAGAAAEPLLVIGTSRRPFPGDNLEQHRLPEFTEPETSWLTEPVPGAKRIPGDADHRFHKLLHRFTGGYPAAAAFLTETAYNHPYAVSGGLGPLLTMRLDDGMIVEDRLLADLTAALLGQPGQPPFPDSALDSLVSCALALTQGEADLLAREYSTSFAVTPVLLAASGLWNEDEQTSAHKLLTRLLLRRLAARDSGQPSWETVCGRLRDRRRDAGDLAGELYYTLAAGELDTVTRRLSEHLSGQGLEQSWLSHVTFVTMAPRAAQDQSTSLPYQQQIELARSVADDATSQFGNVAQLVAGLWLDEDPCTPPDREDLHSQIASDYRALAPNADHPSSLQREAKEHDALARYWS